MPSLRALRVYSVPGLCAVLGVAGLSGSALAQPIDLGQASNFAVFGLGSTMNVGSTDTVTGNTATIYGNVAVGADTNSPNASGDGTFQKGFITGNLYVDGPITPATYKIVNKNFSVFGTVFGSVPQNPGDNPDSVGTGTYNLSPAVSDAITRSAFYAGLPATSLGAINLNSANQTLSAGTYNASSFLMNSKALLTINGAAGSQFILNVTGDFSFTKSFIKLTGGITADSVLFNILGTGDKVELKGDESIFQGNVVAISREIVVAGMGTGSAQGVSFGLDGLPDTSDDNPGFLGRVIGAHSTDNDTLNLEVHSGAEINDVPSPAGLLVLGAGLPLLRGRRR